MQPFSDRLADVVATLGPACVGLDPHLGRLPLPLKRSFSNLSGLALREAAAQATTTFCLGTLSALQGTVGIVKPQVALFEALGSPGFAALEQVVAAARSQGMLVIADAKRGDIGSTAEAYARAFLDPDGLDADALTLSPYLGPESLQPFLARVEQGKGLFILVRTSNPGAEAWQLGAEPTIASRVAAWIEQQNAGARGACGLGSVGAVVGATLGQEAATLRATMPGAWFLAPGFGAQGAGNEALRHQLRPDGLGCVAVSARAVLFPSTGSDDQGWQQEIAGRAQVFADATKAIARL